jgi:hypothetical protein
MVVNMIVQLVGDNSCTRSLVDPWSTPLEIYWSIKDRQGGGKKMQTPEPPIFQTGTCH